MDGTFSIDEADSPPPAAPASGGATAAPAITPSTVVAATTPQAEAPLAGTGMAQATKDLNLSPQEQNLYQHHLTNLAGPGKVVQPNGDISTILQSSVERDGRTYNIPTVWDGKQLPPDQAAARAGQAGWDKWPSYPTEEEAELRYGFMHDYMNDDVERYIAGQPKKPPPPPGTFSIDEADQPAPTALSRFAAATQGVTNRIVGAAGRGAAEGAEAAGVPSITQLAPQPPEEVDQALTAAENGKYAPDAAAAAVSLRQLGTALAIPATTFLGAIQAVWGGMTGAAQQTLQEAGLSEENAGAVVEGANLVGAHMMASVPEIRIPEIGSRGLPKPVGEGEVIPPVRPRVGLSQPPAPIEGEAEEIVTPPAPGQRSSAPSPGGGITLEGEAAEAPQPAPPGRGPAGPGASPPQPAPPAPAPSLTPGAPGAAPATRLPAITSLDDIAREVGVEPGEEPTAPEGTRGNPAVIRQPGDIAKAEQHVNTEPSEAQIEAGNYQHGHANFQGIPVTIEIPAGAERRGIGPDGQPWSVKMPYPYGYIKRSADAPDGENVDVTIGPHPDSQTAFVVDQHDPRTGAFDEPKSFVGFNTPQEAAAAYDASFSDGSGPSRRRGIAEMPLDQFKEWTKNPVATKTDVADPDPALIRQFKGAVDDPKAGPLNPAALAQKFGTDEATARTILAGFAARGNGVRQQASGFRRTPSFGPLDMLQFIAANGGIRDEGGELAARNAQRFIPGFGALVRKDGMTHDEATQKLWEAGYLGPFNKGYGQQPQINDMLFQLDRALAGMPVHSAFDDAEVAAKQPEYDPEQEAHEVYQRAQELGIAPHPDATTDEIKAMIREREAALMEGEGHEQQDAHRDDIERDIDETLPHTLPEAEDELPWFDERGSALPGEAAAQPPPARGPPEAGVGQSPAGEEAPGGQGAGPPAAGRGPGGGEGVGAPGERGPAVDTERPKDSHGNPIFKKGERVVIGDEGEFAGRHGEIADAHAIVMQPIFGGGPRETSYQYIVRTDQGTETHASRLATETERPGGAVPDPMWHGKPVTPQSLKRGIGYDLQSANKALKAAANARKPENKRSHDLAAENYKRDARAKRDALDAWRDQYPAEAARVLGEKLGEKPVEEGRPIPATDVSQQTIEPAGFSIVETKHTRDNYPLFVATLKDRVSPERFADLRRMASGAGGHYSSFRGRGAVPGFQFKTREAAEKFVTSVTAPTAPAAPPAPVPTNRPPEQRGDWAEIGKNEAGTTLYEDPRGVRSIVENGVRRTEPVSIRPTREGAPAIGVDHKAHPEYLLHTPHPFNMARASNAIKLLREQNLDNAEIARRFNSLIDTSQDRDMRLLGHAGLWMLDNENKVKLPPVVAPPAQEPIIPPGEETAHGAPPGPEGAVPANAPGERPEAVPGVAPEQPVGQPRGPGVPGGERPLQPTPPGQGIGSGITAGGGGAGQVGVPGLPGAGARPEPGAAGRPPKTQLTGKNYVIDPGATEENRSFPQKARDNLTAIELAKQLIAEKRAATPEEQAVLVKYVGWGGLRGAFDIGEGFRRGFEDVGKRLKQALTPDEYRTAARSTQYAHYTAEHVIRSMWDAVQRMGFAGGNVFEPGMGIGHFLGMMPPDLAAKTRYQGLELDHLTADIAKLLYPESGVRQADFTRTPIPEGSFDLAIGNPPFSDVVIRSDPKYSARGFMLHDYFFAKSLDSIRPGGLMAYVTSAGTMNKIDPAARRYLAERAEFLGGVRLPSTAFARNAGTEVTTDILFFKKMPSVTAIEAGNEPAWAQTVVRTLPDSEGKPIQGNVSRYFSEHPEMVLGEEGFFDKLYQGRYAVHGRPDQDLAADLRAAIERLPRDVMAPEPTLEQKAALDFEATEKKEGSFYLKDGRIMQYRGGAGREVQRRGAGVEGGFTVGDIERIQHLVPMRDALRDVFKADLARDEEAGAAARKVLNQHYDAFMKKFGPVNKTEFQYRRPTIIQQEAARAEAREEARDRGDRWLEGDFDATPMIDDRKKLTEIAQARAAARNRAAETGRKFDEGSFDPAEMADVVIEKHPNIEPFRDDPENYRLRAIEDYDASTGKSAKKDIFTKNILAREVEPAIKSPEDAVMWSLNKRGRLDLDAMSEKLGMPRDQVIDHLGDRIFRVPGTRDAYQTADEYLSGDVVSKLAAAKAAAETEETLRPNVIALEKVQPPPLSPAEISMSIGMPWIPVETYSDFAANKLTLGDPQIRYSAITGQWMVAPPSRPGLGVGEWSTRDRAANLLLSDAMNRTPPRIYREEREPDGSKTRVFDPVATQAAQDKVDGIKNAFDDWMQDDPDRREKMAGVYNAALNRVVPRVYDGGYLTTPGVAADWTWREHQRRGVARVVLSGNTYIAHAVGSGKTSLYIGAGMEMRRLGLVRKPMYVVPNHMLAQFAKEFYQQYPLAKIAIADERQFHTDRRKQFIASVSQDDLDGIVITNSAFGKIPTSEEFQRGLIREQIEALEQAMSDLDKNDDRFTIRRLENMKEKLEQRLSRRNPNQDAVNTFEEMGVDFLFTDEAHQFRKLAFASKHGSLKGITPEGSQMAWDLYSKVRYLETQRPGRSAVFGSGTPVTNTMGELYSISRYLQPEALAERGLSHFDAWANTFGDVVTKIEQTAEGTYSPVTRFARFVNMPELYKMVAGVMDIVTPAQLEKYVVRPKLESGARQFHLAPRTPFLDAYQNELGLRVAAIKARKGPPQKGDDILLSVINDGRLAAIDPRFFPQGRADDAAQSKLSMMVSNAFDIWKATKNQQFYDPATNYEKPLFKGPATQMIFANLGIDASGSRGFSAYQFMKRELIRRGVPANEIAFIKDYKSHVAKQKLFNDMNDGKVRILIGSTQKMGTGVNAQRRLVALHNQDPLWYPADDEQRVGRILRQGNLNKEIGVHDYSTKGTYDATMWQLMGNKGRFIEQFFRGDPELRDMDDLGEAGMYEQASAMSTSDERVIKLTELKQELDKALRRQAAHEREQYGMRRQVEQAKNSIRFEQSRAAFWRQMAAQRKDTRGDAFSMNIMGKEFAKRADATHEIERQAAIAGPLMKSTDTRPLGQIGGFPVEFQAHKTMAGRIWLSTDIVLPEGMRIGAGDMDEPKGVIQSLEAGLRSFGDRAERALGEIPREQRTIDQLTPQLGKEFAGGPQIAQLTQAVRELEKQLKATAEAKTAQPPAPRPEGTAFERAAPPFYSALERGIEEAKQEKAPAGSWKGYIHNLAAKGVRQEEVDWTGVNDWLDQQKGSVSKADLLQAVRENNVQLQEVHHAEPNLIEGGKALDAVEAWGRAKLGSGDYRNLVDNMLPALEHGDDSVLPHLRSMGVPDEMIQHIANTGAQGRPRYGRYRLPGGENYRELLLTMPPRPVPIMEGSAASRALARATSEEEREHIRQRAYAGGNRGFTGPHWEEPNVLAHVRFDDRTDADGKRTLHVAEIQSDLHQRGRRTGYRDDKFKAEAEKRLDEIYAEKNALAADRDEATNRMRDEPRWHALAREQEKLVDEYNRRVNDAIAPAPFKTSWPELAMKRVLRYAAENGYDRVSWDTGDTNADRYDLSHHVDHVDHSDNGDGTYNVEAGKDHQQIWHDDRATPQIIADHLGKEIADKIVAGEGDKVHAIVGGRPVEQRRLSGLDLKVGGKGMREFYDKMLPSFVNRYAKKWGAKVGETRVPAGEGPTAAQWLPEENQWEPPQPGEAGRTALAHYVEITPAMRKSVLAGQPMFAPRGWERAETGNEATRGQEMRLAQDVTGHIMPTEAYAAHEHEIVRAVADLLERIAPGARNRAAASLRGMWRASGENIPIHGAMIPGDVREGIPYVIAWSLESPDALRTARHEALHYLYRSGLLTDQEWETLRQGALREGWIEQHGIDRRYPGASDELKLEEAIADHFGAWDKAGAKLSSLPEWLRPIYWKIKLFLRQIAAAARRILGKNATPDDIFTKMETGEVGGRAAPAAERPTEEMAAHVPGQKLFLDIAGRRFPVDSFEDASRKFLKVSAAYGEGASQTPSPLIVDSQGKTVGYVTYNGRVFEGTPQTWTPESKILYDSRALGATLDQTTQARRAGPLAPGQAVDRMVQFQAEREAEAAGNRVAGHPAQSFQEIERASREEPPLLPTREATPQEMARRKAAEDKAVAEAKMAGRKVAKKPQASADDLPLFGGERQKTLFSMGEGLDAPEPEEERGPLGKGVAVARGALNRIIAKASDVLSEAQMAMTPMAEGNAQTRAVAKEFANRSRLVDYEFNRTDHFLERNFTPMQRREMYNALDEQSVYEQLKANEAIPAGEEGALTPEGARMLADMRGREATLGLKRLSEPELDAVRQINATSKLNIKVAKKLGMYEGDGIPWYAPRYIVQVAAGEALPVGGEGEPQPLNPLGANIRTTTSRLMHRQHLTAEETEAAAQKKFGAGAMVVRDIRAVAHANRELARAIAGRALIERIRKIGHSTGQLTVSDGAKPEDPTQSWFTVPQSRAFMTRRAKLEPVPGEPGKMQPVRNSQGHVVTEPVPVYVRGDFEGPLRAVMSTEGGSIYQGFMQLKGRTMSVIMYSPVIHNQVEWGRAMFAMPGKVATFRIYFEGNAAKRGVPYAGVLKHIQQYTPGLSKRFGTAGTEPIQSPAMREAINAGMVPIGHYYGFQDITSVLNDPNIAPGRSWTAQLLGAIPGLFDERAGDAVKRTIDRMGDIWHNALLWDRVGDLQMGLYTNYRDHLTQKLASQGITGPKAEKAAQVAAAHIANRYAGALPIEAMSGAARRISNALLFSRSFSLGNLGVMKDAISGLPRDAQAQIMSAASEAINKTVKSAARRKAISILMLDIMLGAFVGNAILQSGIAILSGDSSLDKEAQGYARRLNRLLLRARENPADLLNPFWDVQSLLPQGENEPGKEDYVLVGYGPDGAVYMNPAVGKIGREFEGWLTGPLDMLRRKAGTLARPAMQVLMNDDGFGNKVYDPWNGVTGAAENALRLGALFFQDQLPSATIRAAMDWYAGRGSRATEIAQILGPLALGATFSRGAPGGPAMGEVYRAKDAFWFKFHENMPSIRRSIQDHEKDGNYSDAIKAMTAIGIPSALQRYEIRATINPASRLTGKQLKDFGSMASPEMRQDLQRFMNEENERATPQTVPQQ